MILIKRGSYTREPLPHIYGQHTVYRYERKVFINYNEFKQIVYGSVMGPYSVEIYYQDERIQDYIAAKSHQVDSSVNKRAEEWLKLAGLDRVYKYKELL